MSKVFEDFVGLVEGSDDQEYIAAMLRGDLPHAQKMVRAAARSKGYRHFRVHQTSGAAKKQIYQNGFSLKYGQARMGDEQMPDAFFFKSTGKDIKVGAAANTKQIPVYLKFKKPLVFKNRAALEQWLREDPDYAKIKDKIRATDDKNKLAYDKEEKKIEGISDISDADFQAYLDYADKAIDSWKAQIRALAAQARKITNARLKRSGYDAIILRRDEGSFGRSVVTTAVFDPKQIKSADPATYARGKIVPLSARFNSRVISIREDSFL